MPKRMTGRKKNVLMDDMGYKKTDGGLYCILPFANLNENAEMKGDERMGAFKLGMTTSFVQRLDQYHTTFPLGVHIFAILSDIPIPPGTRARPKPTKKTWYLKAEKFLFQEITRLGAKQVRSTTRIHGLGTNLELGGQSEYFLCSIDQIHEAFTSTWKKFGGQLEVFNAEEKGGNFNKDNQKKISSASYAGVVPFV